MNADPNLSPEQRQGLADAKERSRAFMGAVRTATFNIWTIGAFAAITILFGLFSLPALLLGIGMAVVTWNEYRGRAMVRRFDPAGPLLLGRNQLGLMGLIILYALWSMYRATNHPDPGLVQLDAVMGGDVSGLVADLTILIYLAVIALTALFQGLLARYYFRRIEMVEAYVRDTPEWVLEMQRAAVLD